VAKKSFLSDTRIFPEMLPPEEAGEKAESPPAAEKQPLGGPAPAGPENRRESAGPGGEKAPLKQYSYYDTAENRRRLKMYVISADLADEKDVSAVIRKATDEFLHARGM
jgi:hypothetical protein